MSKNARKRMTRGLPKPSLEAAVAPCAGTMVTPLRLESTAATEATPQIDAVFWHSMATPLKTMARVLMSAPVV